MKKAGIILFTLVLCAGTVFSFAYTASPKEKIDSDIIARAVTILKTRCVKQEGLTTAILRRKNTER